MILQEQINRSMNYAQYRNLLEDLLAHGKTTGPIQNEAYLNYAKINLQRMLRLDKTVTLTGELTSALSKINTAYDWVVLTEGWCGDASQIVPVLALIEQACPFIKLRLLLRDENLQLMDQYLTAGSRSIPKLICVEAKTLSEIFTWGPRPAEIQALVSEMKKNETPYAEKALQVQKWYNADKTMSLQKELAALVEQHLTAR